MGLKERATAIFLAVVASASVTAFAAEPESVPGEFIVKMRTPVSEDKAVINALSSRLGAHVKSVIPEGNLVVIQRPVFETTHSVLKSVAADADVEYVEPNYIYHINKTPNDPMLGDLWGMNNTGKPGIDIGALQAWDIETGDKDLVVGVIDTGINYNHNDLKKNMWTNTAELNGQPGVDDDGNGVVDDIYGYNAAGNNGNPLDDHGHGSHCSGTIGASGDDGQGIVGVAWNVKLMGIKFLTASGSGTLENAVKAIDYGTKMGAKILSNSWGGGGFSQALLEAIQRANNAGVLFVAAAGNESNNNDASPTYPATYDVPNVLTVAAMDRNGQLASFSNYGKTKVHVGAPGVAIKSSINTGGYATWDGTSMAAPHVSGIAALLLSHEPNLTAVEAKARIIATAKRVSSMRTKVSSGGMANAYAALMNQTAAPDPNDPSNWATIALNVASAHPYANNTKETYNVKVPGAKQIALYFSRLEVENRYDFVTIKDAKGNVIDKLSGNNGDMFSGVIEGDSAVIEFTSDGSNVGFGFEITKAAWR